MKANRMKWAGLLVFASAFMLKAQSNEPAIRAWVDSKTLFTQQAFVVSVEISGDQQATPSVPSLDRWADFLGTSTQTSFQMVNGVSRVSKTMQFQYLPLKTGRFTIPPFMVEIKGKTYKTDLIDVEVQKGQPASPQQNRQSAQSNATDGKIGPEDLYIKAELSKRSVFVNEPVLLTYTIYTRVNTTRYEWVKQPGTAGFWAEEIGIGNQLQTRVEVVNGRRYTAAAIKRTLLFPMTAGTKTIDPLTIRCQVRMRSQRRSIFDDFFNDRSVEHVVSSSSVNLDVKPLPAQEKPDDFNGLVGNFTVSHSVDKRQAATNDAITYRLVISGSGNLKGLSVPEPDFPDGLEVYPPEVKNNISFKDNTLSGSKTFEWVLVPRKTGQLVIPGYSLSFFSPARKSYEISKASDLALSVRQGSGGLDETGAEHRVRRSVSLLGQDIRYLKRENVKLKAAGVGLPRWMLIYFILLPILVLLPVWMLRRHQDRLADDVAFARQRRAGRLAKKHLGHARTLRDGDDHKAFYAEVGRAVTGFIGDKLNMPTAGWMSQEVDASLEARGVAEPLRQSVQDLLSRCDMMRFSPAAADKTGRDHAYKEAETLLNKLNRELN